MHRALIAAVVAVLVFSLPTPAAAQSDDETEAPSSPYGFLTQAPDLVDGVLSDADCDACQGGVQVAAENFVWFSNVCWIDFWGGYLPGSAPPQDSFTVVFHDDAGGLPGPVVATYAGLRGHRSATGRTVLGVDEYHYFLELDPAVWLDGSVDHWVEIYNDTPGSSESFFWETGDLDPNTGLPGHAVASEAPGSAWLPVPGAELAIILTTDCVPFPTMSRWGLLLLALILAGVAGLALRKRAVQR